MQVVIGVLFHAVGASCAALCYTPQKKVSGWSWQTYWMAQAVVCWLLLPVLGAWVMIPHLHTVLSEAPTGVMWKVFGLGAAYGIGGTAFGIAIRYMGYSLTYAISVGISCVLGTLLPPLVHGELLQIFQRPGAWLIGTGVGMGALGIALCGAAGRSKELALSAGGSDRSMASDRSTASGSGKSAASGKSTASGKSAPSSFNLAKGLPLCLLAGVLSAVYGFAIDLGQPIADIAGKYGAGNFQGEVIYIFSNSGAFVSTLLYCLYLHRREHTLGEYVRVAPAADPIGAAGNPAPAAADPAGVSRATGANALPLNFLLAALTGCLWYGQFFFYALGHIRMGSYKFTSWAIHMTMLVLFSALTGLALKEWVGSGPAARKTLGWALSVLVTAILLLCYGNYTGNA
jgi:L-rhamnose-H+ transport protein